MTELYLLAAFPERPFAGNPAAQEADTGWMANLARVLARAALIPARASRPDADFVLRFFAPPTGMDEDQE